MISSQAQRAGFDVIALAKSQALADPSPPDPAEIKKGSGTVFISDFSAQIADENRPRPLFNLSWWALGIAIIVMAVISRVGMIAWPFLNDSGLFAAMGRSVAQGHVLYRDFYETKLPGAALLASVFWRAFGCHWAGYVFCQLTMAMVAALLLARSAHRHFGAAAIGPTFLFAVVYLNLSQAVYTGFQLETIQVFFECLAAVAALESLGGSRRWAFIAGLAAGVAGMAKPGGVGIAVVLMLCEIYWRLFNSRGRKARDRTAKQRILPIDPRPCGLGYQKTFEQPLAVIFGLAIPTAVTLIYTVRSGSWEYLPGVIRDIANYSKGTPLGWDAALRPMIVLLVLGFPFFVRLIRRNTGLQPVPDAFPEKLARARGAYHIAMGWFLIDLLAALAQRRMYPYHFLPLAAPAALLFGMMRGPVKPLRLAIGLLPVALLSLTWEGSSISQIHRGREHDPVSDYITARTASNDTVFADQIGRLLIETDRQPGSRLGTFFSLVNDDDAPRRYMSMLLGDFETRRPKYLALASGWDRPVPGLANCDILQRSPQRRASFIAQWQLLREYVARNYHSEAHIQNMDVYLRN